MENAHFYLCKNQKCCNHFLKKGATGIKISFKVMDVTNIPRCKYCRKFMGSELEQSIFFLKQELALPDRVIN